MGSFQEWDFLGDLKNNSNNLSNSKFNTTIADNGNFNYNNNTNNSASSSNNGFTNGFGNGYHSNSNSKLDLGGNSNSNPSSLNGSTGYTNNNSTNSIENKDDDPKFITHTLTPQDTLQGLSIKYGVKVDEIKRINKIWSQDSLFLKKTLQIPRVENNDGENNSNNNNSNNNINNNSGFNSTSVSKPTKSKDINNGVDHNIMFPEFERMSTSFGTKPKPTLPEYKSFPNNYGNENTNWTSVPMSTFSLSPVVTSLDQKTQNQFSLLDEEFNPL